MQIKTLNTTSNSETNNTTMIELTAIIAFGAVFIAIRWLLVNLWGVLAFVGYEADTGYFQNDLSGAPFAREDTGRLDPGWAWKRFFNMRWWALQRSHYRTWSDLGNPLGRGGRLWAYATMFLHGGVLLFSGVFSGFTSFYVFPLVLSWDAIHWIYCYWEYLNNRVQNVIVTYLKGRYFVIGCAITAAVTALMGYVISRIFNPWMEKRVQIREAELAQLKVQLAQLGEYSPATAETYRRMRKAYKKVTEPIKNDKPVKQGKAPSGMKTSLQGLAGATSTYLLSTGRHAQALNQLVFATKNLTFLYKWCADWFHGFVFGRIKYVKTETNGYVVLARFDSIFKGDWKKKAMSAVSGSHPGYLPDGWKLVPSRNVNLGKGMESAKVVSHMKSPFDIIASAKDVECIEDMYVYNICGTSNTVGDLWRADVKIYHWFESWNGKTTGWKEVDRKDRDIRFEPLTKDFVVVIDTSNPSDTTLAPWFYKDYPPSNRLRFSMADNQFSGLPEFDFYAPSSRAEMNDWSKNLSDHFVSGGYEKAGKSKPKKEKPNDEELLMKYDEELNSLRNQLSKFADLEKKYQEMNDADRKDILDKAEHANAQLRSEIKFLKHQIKATRKSMEKGKQKSQDSLRKVDNKTIPQTTVFGTVIDENPSPPWKRVGSPSGSSSDDENLKRKRRHRSFQEEPEGMFPTREEQERLADSANSPLLERLSREFSEAADAVIANTPSDELEKQGFNEWMNGASESVKAFGETCRRCWEGRPTCEEMKQKTTNFKRTVRRKFFREGSTNPFDEDYVEEDITETTEVPQLKKWYCRAKFFIPLGIMAVIVIIYALVKAYSKLRRKQLAELGTPEYYTFDEWQRAKGPTEEDYFSLGYGYLNDPVLKEGRLKSSKYTPKPGKSAPPTLMYGTDKDAEVFKGMSWVRYQLPEKDAFGKFHAKSAKTYDFNAGKLAKELQELGFTDRTGRRATLVMTDDYGRGKIVPGVFARVNVQKQGNVLEKFEQIEKQAKKSTKKKEKAIRQMNHMFGRDKAKEIQQAVQTYVAAKTAVKQAQKVDVYRNFCDEHGISWVLLDDDMRAVIDDAVNGVVDEQAAVSLVKQMVNQKANVVMTKSVGVQASPITILRRDPTEQKSETVEEKPPATPTLSFEEREKAYNEARARIFAQPAKQSLAEQIQEAVVSLWSKANVEPSEVSRSDFVVTDQETTPINDVEKQALVDVARARKELYVRKGQDIIFRMGRVGDALLTSSHETDCLPPGTAVVVDCHGCSSMDWVIPAHDDWTHFPDNDLAVMELPENFKSFPKLPCLKPIEDCVDNELALVEYCGTNLQTKDYFSGKYPATYHVSQKRLVLHESNSRGSCGNMAYTICPPSKQPTLVGWHVEGRQQAGECHLAPITRDVFKAIQSFAKTPAATSGRGF